jgi:hypothetical protein
MAPFRSGEVAAGPSHPASAALDRTPATTGAAHHPQCPRARSVIQGVVDRRLRPYLFGSLAFSSHVLQAKTFGHFSKLGSRCRYR